MKKSKKMWKSPQVYVPTSTIQFIDVHDRCKICIKKKCNIYDPILHRIDVDALESYIDSEGQNKVFAESYDTCGQWRGFKDNYHKQQQ